MELAQHSCMKTSKPVNEIFMDYQRHQEKKKLFSQAVFFLLNFLLICITNYTIIHYHYTSLNTFLFMSVYRVNCAYLKN